MNTLLSRRRFLKGLTSSAAIAPLSLPGLTRMAMASETQQSRLKVVFFVIPDGFGTDSFNGGFNQGIWFPDAPVNDSDQFTLKAASQVLADYRSQSLYLQGLICGPGNAGHNGWKQVLRDSSGSQTSIDNILGQVMVGTDPSQRVIYAGPHANDHVNWFISWNGNQMRVPQDDPGVLFQQIFGNISGGDDNSGSGNSRSHLFDPVTQDLMTLRQKLSGSERAKLDTHLDAVEQVATDLDNTGEPSSGCSPQAPGNFNLRSPDYRNQVQQAHNKVVATTLGCGISRVATIQVGRSADQVVLKDVSSAKNPHDLAHRYAGEREWRESRQWYARQCKLFLDELAKHDDPDVPSDSLLDHTLVVLTSEMSDGAPEHQYNMPMVLLGGASGMVNNGTGNGRYLNITDQGDRDHWAAGKQVDMQRIWSTLAQAMGTSTPYGGDNSAITGIFRNV